MSIIELELNFSGPFTPVSVFLNHESSDGITDWSWNQQILLFKSQFFTGIGGIIWIKNTGYVFSILSFLQGFEVVTLIEWTKIEFIVGEGAPESQVDGVEGVVAGNGGIIGTG